MRNRLFSMVIVPDDGSEIRRSNFTYELATYGFCLLVAVFFVCVFFIVGFHVKLSQENDFKTAIEKMQNYTEKIETSRIILTELSDRLHTIQRNDIAYRKYAYMDLPDSTMYLAGIGGHLLFDETILDGLNSAMVKIVSRPLLDTVALTSRVNVQETSFSEIQKQILKNQDEFNCTPSILPTHSLRITSGYGNREHPVTGIREFHEAVDIAGNRGQRIYTTADGTIIQAKYSSALGNYIVIQHKYGYETLFGHLTQIMVSEGQKVKKGEIIGTLGSTGRATGPHLHYAITLLGKSVNPMKYF
ncbi:M23 family metallopeptidase [Candidatus Latescibacterota bacterium]